LDKASFIDVLSVAGLFFAAIAPFFVTKRKFSISGKYVWKFVLMDMLCFSLLLAVWQFLCWTAAALVLILGGSAVDALFEGKVHSASGSAFAFGSGFLLITFPCWVVIGMAWIWRKHAKASKIALQGGTI
jgi:hypothetical protein